MYDYCIVGSGLFGSIFAHEAKLIGKKVLVLEKRNHIGGNCYTENIDGINVHKYGPHTFHTNDLKIWNYINQFCSFNNFTLRIKVNYKDKIYSFPINLFTLYQLWGVQTPKEAQEKLKQVGRKIDNPSNLEDWCIANLGEEIYEIFFKGYTSKQWRTSPQNIPSSIIKRLPIYLTYDDNYHKDKYQGIPIGGYTQIFEKMLDGVEVKLNTPLESDWHRYAKKIVYTGRPDVLLDYKYGELPYLTLNFEHKKEIGDFQGNAVINYTDIDVPYTRIVEHKHFEYLKCNNTIITYEYPVDWHENAIPYYPIPIEENQKIWSLYYDEIKKDENIILGGRLGMYKYYNMDQVVASALKLVEKTFG